MGVNYFALPNKIPNFGTRIVLEVEQILVWKESFSR